MQSDNGAAVGNTSSDPLSALLQAVIKLQQLILSRGIKIRPQYSTTPLIMLKHRIALLFLTPKFMNSQ